MTFKTAFRAESGFRKVRSMALMSVMGVAMLASPAWAESVSGQSPEAQKYWALLDDYCTKCHNVTDWAGGIAFDAMMTPDSIPHDAKEWEAAVRKLRGRLMPPPGNPQPDQAEVDRFVHWMEASLDDVAPDPNAGHVPIHRLNRTEFATVVKGLIGVDLDPKAILPTELEVDGFSNIAGALSVSPAFLGQYIAAARKAAHIAIGDPEGKTASSFFTVPVYNQYKHIEGMPLGTRGGMSFMYDFPSDGEYRFNVKDVGAGLYLRQMEQQSTMVVLIDDREVFRTDIGGKDDLYMLNKTGAEGRAAMEKRVSDIAADVKAGRHKVTVTFIERADVLSDDWNSSRGGFRGFGHLPRIGEGVEVWGPYNATGVSATASRDKIFVCQPETAAQEEGCAEKIATHLAGEAYRRPVTKDDVARLMPFYQAGRANGGSFDKGIEQIVAAVLVSPDFLYRSITPPEGKPADAVYALSDLELASRLSFFLWSQGPDDQLIQVAAKGDLSKPKVLKREVLRMLDDPRAQALVDNFAMQWLNVDDLTPIEPDPIIFRGFNDQMRDAFTREIRMFLASVLLEDHTVLDLLTADYTFLNEALAENYGIKGVHGSQFRKVTLKDPNRFGILGKAAVLLRTSYGNRTSPVLRGAWVLEKLLGTPPSPPPPNVPDLPENKPGQKALTVRARLEIHRSEPACKACHGVIDPYGLALENFSVIGQWRDRDAVANMDIDPSTVLPDGTAIKGPVELRKHLLERPDQFVQALTERLLMYATGRELQYHDMPEVRAIVRTAAKDDYHFSDIVMGIVNSDAFRLQAPPEKTDSAIHEAALTGAPANNN
jgi:hypothetical protein